MSESKNFARAHNFYHRYNSDLKNSKALHSLFRQRLQQVRKTAGLVFENFLQELKKNIDNPPVDDRYSISKTEYNLIKQHMLEVCPTDPDRFNQILEDLINHRLLPVDFDDWEYKLSGVDSDTVVFTAVHYGYIPEGFRLWQQHNEQGHCIAHLAVMAGILPKDFDQFDLKDKNGYTVQQAIDAVGFYSIYKAETSF